MSGHTPGPWTYELDLVDEGDIDIFSLGALADGLPGMPIATVAVLSEPGLADGPPREQALANALLIDAAPDMFDLLKLLRDDWFEPHYGQNDVGYAAILRDHIRAAIAKAEGR